MKEVSGNTWVQKAVFLEPKALFSSALTMCSRGWYLCMELRMICERRSQSELQALPSFILKAWGPGPNPEMSQHSQGKGMGSCLHPTHPHLASCSRDTLLQLPC